MQVLCPKCGVAIPGVDFDLQRGIAACRPCGEVVPLTSPEPPPDKLYKPASFRFIEQVDGERYQAVVPPHRLRVLPALGFCIFWDGFMAVWYGIAIFGHMWPMALFGSLHLAIGIFFTHKTLVALLNTARLSVGDGVVTFKSGPVPTRGNFQLPIDRIDGFVVREKGGSRSSTPFVVANLADGTFRDLYLGDVEPMGLQYAAASFADALKRARAKRDDTAYRG